MEPDTFGIGRHRGNSSLESLGNCGFDNWGYIIPEGNFTLLQNWWISFAGNLVSVLVGVAAVIAALLIRSRPWRHWLASFARLDFFYSLVFYPVFSLITEFGDFQVIYGPLLARVGLGGGVAQRFDVPALFGLALAIAIAHVLLLAGLVALDRHPRFRRWLLLRTAPPEMERLVDEARGATDAESSLRLAEIYANNGDDRLAKAELESAAALYPDDPRPPFGLAQIAAGKGRHDQALELYEQAIRSAPSGATRLKALALEGMAHAEVAHGHRSEALAHMTEAVDSLRGDGLAAEADVVQERRDQLAARLGLDT